MNLTNILSILGTVLVSAPAVWAFTQAAKKANAIKWLQPDQDTRLRAVSGVLSALAVGTLALSNHQLTGDNLKDIVFSGLEILAVWRGSHEIHTAIKKATIVTDQDENQVQ